MEHLVVVVIVIILCVQKLLRVFYFLGTWPRYAAHLVIEVAADDVTGERYVRVFHDTEEVRLPLSEHAWCPFAVFRDSLQELFPEDYSSECQCEGVPTEFMGD